MALEHGAIDVAFVVQWADAQIAEQERPSEALLELSMASRRAPLDLVGLLRQMSGELVEPVARDLFVQLLARALDAAPSRTRAVVSSLYLQAGNTLRLDDELDDWASYADDRLCLPAAGLVALSFDEECAAIRSEVNDFAERARRRGVEWPSVK